MFNDIGTKDNRFGMLVSDPTTGKPCKYGAVMEVSIYCRKKNTCLDICFRDNLGRVGESVAGQRPLLARLIFRRNSSAAELRVLLNIIGTNVM